MESRLILQFLDDRMRSQYHLRSTLGSPDSFLQQDVALLLRPLECLVLIDETMRSQQTEGTFLKYS